MLSFACSLASLYGRSLKGVGPTEAEDLARPTVAMQGPSEHQAY